MLALATARRYARASSADASVVGNGSARPQASNKVAMAALRHRPCLFPRHPRPPPDRPRRGAAFLGSGGLFRRRACRSSGRGCLRHAVRTEPVRLCATGADGLQGTGAPSGPCAGNILRRGIGPFPGRHTARPAVGAPPAPGGEPATRPSYPSCAHRERFALPSPDRRGALVPQRPGCGAAHDTLRGRARHADQTIFRSLFRPLAAARPKVWAGKRGGGGCACCRADRMAGASAVDPGELCRLFRRPERSVGNGTGLYRCRRGDLSDGTQGHRLAGACNGCAPRRLDGACSGLAAMAAALSR